MLSHKQLGDTVIDEDNRLWLGNILMSLGIEGNRCDIFQGMRIIGRYGTLDSLPKIKYVIDTEWYYGNGPKQAVLRLATIDNRELILIRGLENYEWIDDGNVRMIIELFLMKTGN